MITLPGYIIAQELYSSLRTKVYRGVAVATQTSVIIKILQNEYPTFHQLVQFRNQYTIAKNLNLPGVIKHLSLENYGNGFALILEDFGGIPLSNYIPFPEGLIEFFTIALQIVKTLEGLHQQQIIHKDIKPSNILINPQTKQIKLIDFSISSLLPQEKQEIINPNILEGTLLYLSPEQTGRMNRGIDYRTDFYSLGVTFYELLTGQLPFLSQDPMELVHCHIAKQATPPINIQPVIPPTLNDIVMKLMAKMAEDRYQSAFGIQYDLERCRQEYLATGQIATFELGTRDITERFLIPEKLYGRDVEVASLLAAFDRIAETNLEGKQPTPSPIELMLVAGFSGIGKTAVVNEVHKPIVRQRGYFIKGKFDQFKRNIPFSAWVQAFQNLMRQLLTETVASLQTWKTKILEALGDSSQVIIDVIPELELLIGKQPPVPEAEGMAAQNRFHFLFGKFIRLFATQEHPLVIFLDDLQWADFASLKLMEWLMEESDSHYLLLIGAYRDNEVSASHPLILTLDKIRNNSGIINQITLPPLDLSSLNCLICDTLSCPQERAIPLTELVFSRTQGNPFFSERFLKSLYEEKLITFDFKTGYWQCDLAAVRALSVSENVVEFMAIQLKKLPDSTQTALKIAACMGHYFDLTTLSIVLEKSQTETAADLWKALQEGLILPNSQVYKFFHDNEEASLVKIKESRVINNEELAICYRFLHDRVQQAAYFLIPEEQKQLTHYKIGQRLLKNTLKAELEERIFDIVNQFTSGIDLITHQSERDELAQLNLIAGRKAKTATAYAAALKYLMAGIELLAQDSWLQSYDLTFALYKEATEVACLNCNFEQMEELAGIGLNYAQTLLDKIEIYDIKILAADVQGNLNKAVQVGLEALRVLGIELSETPTLSEIKANIEETNAYLIDKDVETLTNLPLMQDPLKLATMRILVRLAPSSFTAAPSLFPLLACEQIKLCILHGNSPLSPCGYGDYSKISIGNFQDFQSGSKLGQVAFNLIQKYNEKRVKCRAFLKLAVFNVHCRDNLRQSVSLLKEAYLTALETGDIDQACYSIAFISMYSYFSGSELTGLASQMMNHTGILTHLKQDRALNYHQMFHQVVLNWIGKADDPCQLIGDSYQEEQALSAFLNVGDRLGIFHLYLNKLILFYLLGELEQARTMAAQAMPYLNGVKAMFAIPVFYFYHSLIELGEFANPSEISNPRNLETVLSTQEILQTWAIQAPMNHQHKLDLVEAEKYRVLGQNLDAMEAYDRAIAGARNNEYIQEEALANELAAKFYLAWGKPTIAQTYFTNAYYAYLRWGAQAKLQDLEKRYSQFLAPILKQDKIQQSGGSIHNLLNRSVDSSHTGRAEVLDLGTVLKASQALSSEIRLDRLLSTVMQVAIENAGASKGVLVLVDEGNLAIELVAFVEAEPSSDCSNRLHFSSGSLNLEEEIPLSIVNYVSRTSEPSILADVAAETTFTADSYLMRQQPKSILCSPIINQSKLIGILYLENNLVTGAFTPERLEVLKILSAQAAISIENARLYQTLEEKVQSRTAQLANANHLLEEANQDIARLNEKLKAENVRMSAELDITRHLQQMLLPKEEELSEISGLEIAGFMEPAKEVGGDYYDILQHSEGVKIAIGDVTGHGLESGVLTIMVQMAVRTLLASQLKNSVQFLNALNQAVCENLQRMNSHKNMTLSLLDYRDNTLTLSGQHEDAIVVRSNGEVEKIDTVDLGFPIGLVEDITDFVATTEVPLNSGDVVVLYTDGITEAINVCKAEYGQQRLIEVVQNNRTQSAAAIRQAVIADVLQYIGEQEIYDDITLLILKQK